MASFRIFLMIVGLLLVSAYANVTYNTLLERWDPSLYFWVSALRVLFHGALFAIFFLFTQYIAEVTSLERRAALWVTFIAGVLFVAVVALDIIDSLNHTFGFRIDPDGTVHTGMNIFYVGYFAFVIHPPSQRRKVSQNIIQRSSLPIYYISTDFFFT